MSKIKFIRCKTPHDIMVVKSREDYQELAWALKREVGVASCDHAHKIVCGDIWFARPKK